MANNIKSYDIYLDGKLVDTLVIPSDYDDYNLTKCINRCTRIYNNLGTKKKLNSIRVEKSSIYTHSYRPKSNRTPRK